MKTTPRPLWILACASALYVADVACSHGNAHTSHAMAGAGGAGSGASSGGACAPACAPEAFVAIVETCRPADASHNVPYALHEFPGVGANDLARVVALGNFSPPLYFDFPGATIVLLVKDGAVGAICGNGEQTVTFIVPKF